MVKKKLFLQNQCINITYLNDEDVIKVLNHNKNEDYYENPSLSHLTNFDYRKNGREKAFLAKPKHQYRIAQ